MPDDKWIVGYSEWESEEEPGNYYSWTCSAKWTLDVTQEMYTATEVELNSYLGDKWTEGGRTLYTSDYPMGFSSQAEAY